MPVKARDPWAGKTTFATAEVMFVAKHSSSFSRNGTHTAYANNPNVHEFLKIQPCEASDMTRVSCCFLLAYRVLVTARLPSVRLSWPLKVLRMEQPHGAAAHIRASSLVSLHVLLKARGPINHSQKCVPPSAAFS